jgi:hypothetical protein
MNHQTDDRLQAAFEAMRTAEAQLPSADQHTRARQQFLSEAVSANGIVGHNDQGSAPLDLTIQSGDERMNRKTFRTTRLIAAVLLGVLLAGGFWALPGLRALAQEIISFFVVTESDEQPSSFFVGNPAEDAGEYVDPYTQTLDEVVAQASFDVRLPTFIPRTLTFKGASYRSDPEIVEMIYECRGTPYSYNIMQSHTSEDVPQMEVGPSAVIEEIPIRETVGQYVHGWWRVEVDEAVEAAAREQQGSEPGVREIPATLVWWNEMDFQQMFWSEDGINFSIRTWSGNMDNDINYAAVCCIDQDAYAAIADGLHPASQIQPE